MPCITLHASLDMSDGIVNPLAHIAKLGAPNGNFLRARFSRTPETHRYYYPRFSGVVIFAKLFCPGKEFALELGGVKGFTGYVRGIGA